jgi:23S rRNA pseudouridine2605 synthase
MKERLQKIIANAGICSRRKAEELILGKKVTVNGRIAQIAELADISVDKIVVKGKPIEGKADYIYYAVYKPINYTSTVSDPFSKKNVVDLVPKEPKVFPAGRLDKNSEGLMILTNDGDFTQKITHPSFEHEKEYEVTANFGQRQPKNLIMDQLFKLEQGVRIDGYKTAKAKVTLKKLSNLIKFNIVIHEGKKRQIRKMCESIGWSVVNLKRTRLGSLELGNMQPKEYRIITKDEII